MNKERAMQMFDHDLKILMDNLRGMQAHYQIADWEAFVFLRKPDCPKSYVVKYAAADDGFAKQIVQLHASPDSDRCTPEERAVIKAALAWRTGKIGSAQKWFEVNESLVAACDALSDVSELKVEYDVE